MREFKYSGYIWKLILSHHHLNVCVWWDQKRLLNMETDHLKLTYFAMLKEHHRGTPVQWFLSICWNKKKRFLRYGITPTFTMKGSTETLTRYVNDARGEIRRTYFLEAKNILKIVKEKFGDGGDFIEEMYGDRIDYVQASKQVAQYLKSNHLQGEMTIYWAPDLSCRSVLHVHLRATILPLLQ